MKKFMVLALAAIMLVTFAAVQWLKLPLNFGRAARTPMRLHMILMEHIRNIKLRINHQVYVRHWVIGGSDQYTNLLRQEKLWKVLLIVEANGLLLV
ncbi:MAG: hypothetical protein ACLUN5_17465 [Oscillospiraceae bacterium]